MKHFVGYGILFAMLAFTIYLLAIARKDRGLEVIGRGEGFVEYRNPYTRGLTELVEDVNGNGIYEFHMYSIELSETDICHIMLLNTEEDVTPQSITLKYEDKGSRQNSAAITMTAKSAEGIYRALNMHFLSDGAEQKLVYSDWNFDGVFDSQTVKDGNQMNVLYKNEWVPAIQGKPYKWPEYVTVSIDGRDVVLDFVEGEFRARN